MNSDNLQDKIQALQARYSQMLTQAAQEGRTADIQTISNQMQQEIKALIDGSTQALNSELSAGPNADESQQEVSDNPVLGPEQSDEIEDDEGDDADWDEDVENEDVDEEWDDDDSWDEDED